MHEEDDGDGPQRVPVGKNQGLACDYSIDRALFSRCGRGDLIGLQLSRGDLTGREGVVSDHELAGSELRGVMDRQ